GTGIVTNNGILVFARSDTLNVANQILGSGSGVLGLQNKTTNGTLILGGNNSYGAGTTVYCDGMALALHSATALCTGTFNLVGNNSGVSTCIVRSGTATTRNVPVNVVLGGGNFFQFGAVGTGDLVFNGASVTTDTADKTLTVSNANTT